MSVAHTFVDVYIIYKTVIYIVRCEILSMVYQNDKVWICLLYNLNINAALMLQYLIQEVKTSLGN